MRSLLAVGAALVLAAAAHAKGPARPTPVEVCGSSGCKTVKTMNAGYSLTASGVPARPPRPAPFYAVSTLVNGLVVRAVYVPARGLWRVPLAGALVWTAVPPPVELAIERAAAGLRPYPAAARWRR